MSDQCSNCTFMRVRDYKNGFSSAECRRHAPRGPGNYDQSERWIPEKFSQVELGDWCGEFKAISPEPDLLGAIESIWRYGSDTLSGRVDGPDDREWQRESVLEMTKRAADAIAKVRGAP